MNHESNLIHQIRRKKKKYKAWIEEKKAHEFTQIRGVQGDEEFILQCMHG